MEELQLSSQLSSERLHPLALYSRLAAFYSYNLLLNSAKLRIRDEEETTNNLSTAIDLRSKPSRRKNRRSKVVGASRRSQRLASAEELKTSPVSGTLIRDPDEALGVVRTGDIEPELNLVEVTEEARAELAKIENRIGDFVCKLCKAVFDDAFGLAQHRCAMIVHVEYRCPECEKVFNCPANLASHRRWHRPKVSDSGPIHGNKSELELGWPCHLCPKSFRKIGFLNKHLRLVHSEQSHNEDPNNNEGHTKHSIANLLGPNQPLLPLPLMTSSLMTSSRAKSPPPLLPISH